MHWAIYQHATHDCRLDATEIKYAVDFITLRTCPTASKPFMMRVSPSGVRLDKPVEMPRRVLRDPMGVILKELADDATGKKLRLEVMETSIEEPKHDVKRCREKGLSYESVIRAHVALTNLESGEIKEQDVYFGQIPRMTAAGTFVVNGVAVVREGSDE